MLVNSVIKPSNVRVTCEYMKEATLERIAMIVTSVVKLSEVSLLFRDIK